MPRSYVHLSLEERRKIARWHEAISPASQIVDGLGWNGSQKMSRLLHRWPNSSVRA
jgi:IS30 family transposase